MCSGGRAAVLLRGTATTNVLGASTTRDAERDVVKTKNGEMPMADAWTLRDAFIDELRVAYDAEKQQTRLLLAMAKAASSPDLRALFEKHVDETRAQLVRLEYVFETLDERARGKPCNGIAGTLGEAKALLQADADRITRDACLIAGGRRVEHYEIALYATLVSWARAMSFNLVADVLQQILDEERAADATLTALAESGINQGAADAAYPEPDSEGDGDVPVPAPQKASKRRSLALKVS
jgi:ferritin-like metal-binding protein YciE